MQDSQSSFQFSRQQPQYDQSQSSYNFDEVAGLESQSASMIDPPVLNLKNTFDQLDRQGRGLIRKSKLKSTVMLTSEQYDREIIKEQIDKCEDEINFKKFVDIFQMANVGDSVNQWLFSLYDKKKKGFIDAEDLLRAAEITQVELSQEEIAGMLMTDKNEGNGEVTLEDFKYVMEEELQYL